MSKFSISNTYLIKHRFPRLPRYTKIQSILEILAICVLFVYTKAPPNSRVLFTKLYFIICLLSFVCILFHVSCLLFYSPIIASNSFCSIVSFSSKCFTNSSISFLCSLTIFKATSSASLRSLLISTSISSATFSE